MTYELDYHFTQEVAEYLKDNYNVHNFSKENEDKYLVSYNKTKSNVKDNIDTVGLHRSLIFLNGNLVCFSPPKSLSFENFCDKYPNISENNIIIEEFVEGTMINVFYNNISHSWEISTKNNIGATNNIYKNSIYSFGDLFYDTCNFLGFNLENALDKKYCYSFVMKNPYNPMVEIVTHPQLYLIEVYEIEHCSESNIIIHVKNRNEIAEQLYINWDIKIPFNFRYKSYEDICFMKLFSSMNSYHIRKHIAMGYVIKNATTNERTKLRNPEYEYLHKLKGNQYDFFYHYLLLRQSNKVKKYLQYFVENSTLVNFYRNLVHTFTNNLYFQYHSVHIAKISKLSDVPYCYRQLVYKIHGLYISQKNINPSFKITRKDVIDYVNSLHPSILYTCCKNYSTENSV